MSSRNDFAPRPDRQWGSDRQYVYSYPSRKAKAKVRRKVKALTAKQNTNQAASVLFIRLGQVTRGWAQYFRHGASKTAFGDLHNYLWCRVWAWLRKKHPKQNRKWIVRRYYPNGWWPETNGVALYKPGLTQQHENSVVAAEGPALAIKAVGPRGTNR